MGTVGAFEALLTVHGSDVIYHRDDASTPCPCLTPEGFRDPEWHDAHPTAPVCNERGFLPGPTSADFPIKAMVQPLISRSTGRKIPTEYLEQLYGTIQEDDMFGLFPTAWNGVQLDFNDWSQAGEDYIVYNSQKYLCINGKLVPDPADGNPRHHWECGLRLIA